LLTGRGNMGPEVSIFGMAWGPVHVAFRFWEGHRV
jgi:hypothetical protein